MHMEFIMITNFIFKKIKMYPFLLCQMDVTYFHMQINTEHT